MMPSRDLVCESAGKGAVLVVAAALCGCAGGSPLLHPAHVLEQRQVRFAAGVAANIVQGGAADAITTARGVAGTAPADKPPASYATGALAVAAMSPGVSPFVAARAGLGYSTEAGLGYTGRALRLDGRYAVQGGSMSLSIGAGGSALLAHRAGETSPELVGLQLDGLSGWGVDVPVLFGWRSAADAVWWWAGARGGYENLRGSIGYVSPSPSPGVQTNSVVETDVSGNRFYVSALTGLAFGFRHVHAAVEIQGGYQEADATLWGAAVRVRGLALTPAAAVLGSF